MPQAVIWRGSAKPKRSMPVRSKAHDPSWRMIDDLLGWSLYTVSGGFKSYLACGSWTPFGLRPFRCCQSFFGVGSLKPLSSVRRNKGTRCRIVFTLSFLVCCRAIEHIRKIEGLEVSHTLHFRPKVRVHFSSLTSHDSDSESQRLHHKHFLSVFLPIPRFPTLFLQDRIHLPKFGRKSGDT